jgi:hypothetical protein
MVRGMIGEELAKVKAVVTAQGEKTETYDQAAVIFDKMSLTPTTTRVPHPAALRSDGISHPLTNPVLLAITALVTLLWITGTPYRLYFDGAQFVHFLLGPATVALAIPLARPVRPSQAHGAARACRPARRIAHRLDIRRPHRQPAGCQRRHADFAGAEIRDHADCHGQSPSAQAAFLRSPRCS